MTDAHRSHLYAGLASLEETVRDMTDIARDGRSPTNGQRLTPLSPDAWDALEKPLRRAIDRLTEAVRSLAPQTLSEREQAEGLPGTFFRLAILLRFAEEEIVDGLNAERMERRFGALSAEEHAVIGELSAGLKADLEEARRMLQGMRAP